MKEKTIVMDKLNPVTKEKWDYCYIETENAVYQSHGTLKNLFNMWKNSNDDSDILAVGNVGR